jgi:hypothetical protein
MDAYVSQHVPRKAGIIANRNQHPVLSGDEDLVLTELH